MGKKRKQTFEDRSVLKKAKIDEKVDAFLQESSDEEEEKEKIVEQSPVEHEKEEKAKTLETVKDNEDEDFGGFIEAGAEENSDEEEIEPGLMEKASRILEQEQLDREKKALLEDKERILESLQVANEEIEKNKGVVNIKLVQERINSILDILRDFRNMRTEGKSRSDYVQQLQEDCCTFYGYNEELMSLFCDLFSPDELHAFLESNEEARPLTIRTNTLKTRRKLLSNALKDRGVSLDPIGDWTRIGLKIYNARVPIGATPEYLAGHYLRQSASSFLPVMALNPQPGHRVIDMSAAPGGKTTHIAQLMKNQGILIANDVSKQRLKAVIANVHRLGVTNCLIVNMDGKDLPKHYSGMNRVLLDAPCTGLGVISHDETVKQTRTKQDVWKLSKLQKELILAGIDMLESVSGTATLVYSTCSVSVEENEDVVAYALKKRFVRVADTGFPPALGVHGFKRFREKRFPPTMELTRRYYPHRHNMDGFFVAKLVKFKSGIREEEDETEEKTPEEEGDENEEKTKEGEKKKTGKKSKEKKKSGKKSKEKKKLEKQENRKQAKMARQQSTRHVKNKKIKTAKKKHSKKKRAKKRAGKG